MKKTIMSIVCLITFTLACMAADRDFNDRPLKADREIVTTPFTGPAGSALAKVDPGLKFDLPKPMDTKDVLEGMVVGRIEAALVNRKTTLMQDVDLLQRFQTPPVSVHIGWDKRTGDKLYFVYLKSAEKRWKSHADFFLTDAGQKALSDAGYTPLPTKKHT